ncbi:hypothetical protein LWI29_029346 [Acer saccharum]|uniref:4-coumarate--CoA ligase n=1 Tax=Acer saccharum TaxID=4024 RepID=A0AA39VPD0_ACESA|nr:hypothetical protein LWI29_029346 [Acer saccharum]
MPGDSISDINRLVVLCNPTIAFTNSRASRKLPSHLPTVLLDSPEYLSFFTQYVDSNNVDSSVDVDSDDPVSQQDGASIFYSSGTSGPRKGVFLTHRNWIASTAATAQSYHIPSDSDQVLGRSSSSTPALVSLATRVYTAAYGLSVMMRAVFMGETLVFTGSKFEIERVLEAVDKYKPDYMPVSPSEIQQLWRSELTEKYDLSSLKFIQCSGAPLATEVADKFRAKFPNVKLAIRYGLTETTGAVANMRSPEELERVGSVGRLVEFMEAKIVDPVTDESLPSGHQGELWLRGPSIMKCYVGDDKATAEIMDSEGWLKTGDLCYFDSQGFLFIVDRLKEVIKYNNIKIAPAELEHLLVSNHEIDDAVVVPYPDDEAGEIPMAFVVRNPGSNITDTQVAPYKMIRRVAFISSIPKSANGKILRRELVNSALPLSSNTAQV